MAHSAPLTVIDVGTDTCVTLIAVLDERSQLKIVGVSNIPSQGMRRSQIIDLERVLDTITQSVEAAERMAGVEIEGAYVTVSGGHIASLNSKGVVAVAAPDQEITPTDVGRVIEAARAISLSSDREVLHVIPKYFKVDSQEGIKDPVGMTGVRLEAEAHIITGMSTALRNLEKCVQDVGLRLDGFVFSGLAASSIVLSETEKELGVALIDIGAGCTSIAAYVDGSLEFSGAIPIGARHLTQDIALGCRISLDLAEKIKTSLGSETTSMTAVRPGESKQDFAKRRKEADKIALSDFGIESDDVLSKRTIIDGIMKPRMHELFGMVREQLEKHDVMGRIPAGVVLTGGGALTVECVDVVKRELNIPARIGIPTQVQGLITDVRSPLYATSIGTLLYAKQHSRQAPKRTGWELPSLASAGSLGTSLKKMIEMIRSLFP